MLHMWNMVLWDGFFGMSLVWFWLFPISDRQSRVFQYRHGINDFPGEMVLIEVAKTSQGCPCLGVRA